MDLSHAGYYFEVKRNAGVRTAGILARQSPETLEAIRIAIESGIKQYARGEEFVLPMAAHVIVASKASIAAACGRRALRTAKRLQDGTTRSRRRRSNPRQPCNQNSDRRS